MLSSQDFASMKGRTMMGADGKIGKIDELYADRETGDPTFATVNTGMFGSKTSFVPLQQADLRGDELVVPYSTEQVKDAPQIAEDQDLSPEEEERLYQHYSIAYGGHEDTTATTTGTTATTATGTRDRDGDGVYDDVQDRAVGRDTSGPTTDDAMTLSEERLRVGTERRETGRAKLRKYIVSENVTQTVPVTREEVRLEREPITDANRDRAYSGPDLSEEEHEVTLTEERPVVDKDVVATERVRLSKEQVQENVTVTDEVRKERIDVDGAGTTVDPDARR